MPGAICSNRRLPLDGDTFSLTTAGPGIKACGEKNDYYAAINKDGNELGQCVFV